MTTAYMRKESDNARLLGTGLNSNGFIVVVNRLPLEITAQMNLLKLSIISVKKFGL